MYTLEERQRAVDLYLKYGRKASIVIRELGYPDRKMLSKWACEFEEEGRLHEKPRIWNAYTMEEKSRAVDFYLGHGRQISYTLRSLGYPSRQKLMEWIDELAPGERIIHEGHLKREKHPAMKRKADCVTRLATRSGSAEEAAMDAGVSRSSLYVWKKELAYDIDISMGRKKAKDAETPIIISSIEEAEEIIAGYRQSIADLEERNRELEERRRKAEIELACLEKAAELIKKKGGTSVWKD